MHLGNTAHCMHPASLDGSRPTIDPRAAIRLLKIQQVIRFWCRNHGMLPGARRSPKKPNPRRNRVAPSPPRRISSRKRRHALLRAGQINGRLCGGARPSRPSVSTMEQRPPHLEYAPAAPRRWGLWIRRGIVVAVTVATLAAVVTGALYAGSTLYWRARVRTRLEYLASYQGPPDRIVYDDDRERMDSLLRQPNYDHFPGNLNNDTPRRYAYYDELGGRGVNIGVNRRGHAVLFLHRLKDASGNLAVVEVYLDPWDTLGTWDKDPARRVWVLGAGIAQGYGERDWLTLSNVASYAGLLPFEIDDPRPLRIFAGQPDRADPSRFSIRYELGSTRGTIHGQLLDAGTVQLRAAAAN